MQVAEDGDVQCAHDASRRAVQDALGRRGVNLITGLWVCLARGSQPGWENINTSRSPGGRE